MFGEKGKDRFMVSRNPQREKGGWHRAIPAPTLGPSLSFPTESVYPWSPGVTEGTAYTMDVQETLSLGPSYGFPNPLVGGSSGQTSG